MSEVLELAVNLPEQVASCWGTFILRLNLSDILVTGHCYRVVLYKASHALQLFSDLLRVPI
jgi:hypothetical protein